jgi:large subunit ribosomal protein L10
MDNPRAEKVAVVDEVRERLADSSASVVTEYRGLTVGELADLRQALAGVGGEYKIFKNTLVRLALDGSDAQPLEALLTGPTAITFVKGDVSGVAKTLRDFSRANPNLIIKGGVLDGALLTSGDLTALAELPSREVLLARLAGTLAAPLQQLGGLLQALPRNLAYGLSALIEQRGGAPAEVEAAEPEAAEPEAAAEPEVAEAAAEPEVAEAAAEPEVAEAAAEPEVVAEAPAESEVAEAPAEPEVAEAPAKPEVAAEPAEEPATEATE